MLADRADNRVDHTKVLPANQIAASKRFFGVLLEVKLFVFTKSCYRRDSSLHLSYRLPNAPSHSTFPFSAV
ncbi:hypothetical protein [Stenomitos frigidus]|uniref:hypothetical protein n=1 Tax=Stenomitos frigidus TaxID=1886765 RepID=UPI0015E71980